jgi:hypothetical protein
MRDSIRSTAAGDRHASACATRAKDKVRRRPVMYAIRLAAIRSRHPSACAIRAKDKVRRHPVMKVIRAVAIRRIAVRCRHPSA